MLREYQTQARYRCNALLNAGRHPVYVAPTGTGKTKTAIAIITDRICLKERVFVLTPQLEIFQQWLVELTEAGLRPGYINDQGIIGKHRNIYVCMQPSLINRMRDIREKSGPDILVIDEAHHSAAETYEEIFDYFNNARRLGLTATPYRYDNKPLGEYYTDIVQTITMEDAIKKGYLAKPLVIIPEDYKLKMPIKSGDFDPKVQAKLLGEPKIIGNVIKNYELILQGLPVLVACATYEHASMMSVSFNRAGWRFEHLHSKLTKYTRSSIIDRIKNRKINGVTTVGIGTEGMDIPGLYGLIWLRRTMSLSMNLQFTGRILRPFPGKEFGIIIDCVGNTIIHGRPEWPRQWNLESDYIPPDNIEMILCPVCGVMNSASNILCHICKCNLADARDSIEHTRMLPAMIDGKLIVLDNEDDKDAIRAKLKAQRDYDNVMRKKHEENFKQLKRADKINLLYKGILDRKDIFSETLKELRR